MDISNERGKDLTIGEYLYSLFPNLFSRKQIINQTEPTGDFEFTEVDHKIEILKNYPRPFLVMNNLIFQILIHGMEIPLETPVYWLLINMGFLDNFVYVVIKIQKE